MAKEYKILSPEAAVNLIVNPSFETGTTNWAAIGGSIAQSSTYQRRGAYALAVTPSAGTSDGAYYGSLAFTSGLDYTFSADFLGATTSVGYRLNFGTTAGVLVGTATDFVSAGRWERKSVSWSCTTSGNYLINVRKDSDASTGIYYVDGALCWQSDHDTSYFDGDSEGFLEDGYYWNGTPHASTSVRQAAERTGGQEIDLQTSGFTVSNPIGSGMPAIFHHTQSMALQPGATYNGYKVMPRIVELSGAVTGEDEDDTLEKRKDVINLIKPDLVQGAQPFVLRHYLPNGRGPVEMRLVYDSGLEYNSGDPAEVVNVRCIGYDPLVYEDGQGGAALTTSLSVSNADYVIRKNAGTWANISTDFNDYIADMALGYNGLVYIGGAFTTGAGTTKGDYIVSFDPSAVTVSALGNGLDNVVYAISSSPLGGIYVGGGFTTGGGTTGANRLAYWSGTSWSALNAGLADGAVYTLTHGLDNVLYAGGTFTSHVDTNGDFITKWNGTTFSSLGAEMSDYVRSLATHPDGSIYAAGDFTTGGGTTGADYIAKWNGTAWSALGTGANAAVYAVAIDKNGMVYAGGLFTSIGGVSANRIAVWNGSAWKQLGDGFNGSVRRIKIAEDGLIYVGGGFTASGTKAIANHSAVWNGTTWANIDYGYSGTTGVFYAILPYRENLYLGGTESGTATASYLNTLTNNGTATTYPIFKFKRSGGTSAQLLYIKNETTGATLWCDYSLLDGEMLTIDFRPGKHAVTSSFFGNVIGRVFSRNADFSIFSLLPGENKVGIYILPVGAPTITAYASWQIVHWSADGVAA